MRPRRWSGTAAVAVAAAMALAGTACSGALEREQPLFQGAPTVVVGMDEYRFDYDADIPAGRVVFKVVNTGETVHRLTMVPLEEDIPPIDQQLRGTDRRFLARFAGIPNRAPGDSGTFAVDLVPGVRYAMICFVTDADGQTHAVKGMSSEFRAGGPDARPVNNTTTSVG